MSNLRARRLSDRRSRSSRRVPVLAHRYDEARAVACEMARAAYGAVVAPTGRIIPVPEVVTDRHGREEGVRFCPTEVLGVSYEINERGDRRGFLSKGGVNEARRQGFRSRQAQRELRQGVGATR